ncbi:small acid-soluble spore protein O [Bacillus sp. OVS6]|nr:small acid-soluble spore protein O [Bacillus sp. OVS6]
MAKRKANHVIEGMNAASAQGKGTGYNEEFSNEPLTAAQKQNNKKRKKISNQKTTAFPSFFNLLILNIHFCNNS